MKFTNYIKEYDFLKNPIIFEDLEEIYNRNIDWMRLDGKTVLISGAYGMLAAYFVYFLIFLNEKKNYKINIIAFARNKDKIYSRFGKYADKKYFILEQSDLSKKYESTHVIDFIVHAASLASPQYYQVCPREVAIPNVIGTYNLLELAIEKKPESFLFFSSGVVNGHVKHNQYPNEETFGELNHLTDHACYDESKRMGETFCFIYHKQFNIPTKIVRFGHTFGPTVDIENDPRVFAEFTKNAVYGQNIEMKSEGSAIRAFCYIADATAAEFKVMLDGKCGEGYNICNQSESYKIRDVAEIAATVGNSKVIKKERTGVYLESPFVGVIAPNCSKLRNLGWECKYDLNKSFSRTVKAIKYSKGII